MKYRVIVEFTDLTDSGYLYEAGSAYPRDGLSPSQTRIAELASDKNRRGVPLIEEIIVEKAPEKKPVENPQNKQEEKPVRRGKKKDAD